MLAHVRERTGVDIEVLSGEDEARLTFLAVRRWFGWSAGRLAVFDIGGGSLEIAGGADEAPDVAWSLPLGAARLARDLVRRRPPDDDAVRKLRKQIRAEIARDAGQPAARRARRPGRGDLQDVPLAGPDLRGRARRATARWCRGCWRGTTLAEWIPKLVAMTADELADLPGVSPSRTHQIVPGALVAEACMDIFDLDGAGDLPVGAARGRDPRTHRQALGPRR